MIASFLIALASQAPAAVQTPAPVEEEVVVLGRKLKAWRGKIAGGTTSCVTLKSTGDRDVDAVACTAMERCFPPSAAEIRRGMDKRLAKRVRKQITAAAYKTMGACLNSTHGRLLEELADRRYEQSLR